LRSLLYGLTRAFGVSALCFIAFACVALLVGFDRIAGFDKAVIRSVQGLETPTLTKAMEAVSSIGTTKPVIGIALVVMAFLFFVLRRRKELILFVVVLAGSTVLNNLLKALFRRERPTLHRLVEEAGYSFPSGHSMAAISLYGITAYLLWRHIPSLAGRIVLVVFAAAIAGTIGFSRIYLGVHYPSDVIGGYFMSACWLAASIGVFQRLAKRRRETAVLR